MKQAHQKQQYRVSFFILIFVALDRVSLVSKIINKNKCRYTLLSLHKKRKRNLYNFPGNT